jgi:hypothetical protein
MQLSGPFRRRLRLALQAGYPSDAELRILVAESLNVPLELITKEGDGATVAFNLIEWAIAHGRLTELMQVAAADRPRDVELQAIARDFTFSTAEAGEVERVVLKDVGVETIGEWLESLETLKSRVCRIEPDPIQENWASETGFLIGPSTIIATFRLRKRLLNPERAVVRFDDTFDGTRSTNNRGREYRLASADWCVAERDDIDLGYMVLRLAGRPGDDVLGNRERGFVRPTVIEPADTRFRAGSSILIPQCPAGETPKLSLGVIQDVTFSKGCMTYSAATHSGSAGSPCLNMALETIAMHFQGESGSNHGVLWREIESHLRATGRVDVLER